MLCRGSSGILIVDSSSYCQWQLLQVRRQPPCSDGFACGSQPSPVNRKCVFCRRRKLPKIRFSKLCLFFGPVGPDLYTKNDQGRLRENYNFGTAASYHGQKVGLSREFAEHENETVNL